MLKIEGKFWNFQKIWFLTENAGRELRIRKKEAPIYVFVTSIHLHHRICILILLCSLHVSPHTTDVMYFYYQAYIYTYVCRCSRSKSCIWRNSSRYLLVLACSSLPSIRYTKYLTNASYEKGENEVKLIQKVHRKERSFLSSGAQNVGIEEVSFGS